MSKSNRYNIKDHEETTQRNGRQQRRSSVKSRYTDRESVEDLKAALSSAQGADMPLTFWLSDNDQNK